MAGVPMTPGMKRFNATPEQALTEPVGRRISTRKRPELFHDCVPQPQEIIGSSKKARESRSGGGRKRHDCAGFLHVGWPSHDHYSGGRHVVVTEMSEALTGRAGGPGGAGSERARDSWRRSSNNKAAESSGLRCRDRELGFGQGGQALE